MAEKLGLDDRVHNLKFGKSFDIRDRRFACHSIRYDFKPASVDTSKVSKVQMDTQNSVTVTVPHVEGSGTKHTIYKGNKRPTQKECVLIIDHRTGEITLERLSNTLQLKKTSSACKDCNGQRDLYCRAKTTTKIDHVDKLLDSTHISSCLHLKNNIPEWVDNVKPEKKEKKKKHRKERDKYHKESDKYCEEEIKNEGKTNDISENGVQQRERKDKRRKNHTKRGRKRIRESDTHFGSNRIVSSLYQTNSCDISKEYVKTCKDLEARLLCDQPCDTVVETTKKNHEEEEKYTVASQTDSSEGFICRKSERKKPETTVKWDCEEAMKTKVDLKQTTDRSAFVKQPEERRPFKVKTKCSQTLDDKNRTTTKQDDLILYAKSIKSEIINFLQNNVTSSEMRPHVSSSYSVEQFMEEHPQLYHKTKQRLKVSDEEFDDLMCFFSRNFSQYLKGSTDPYGRLNRLEDLTDFVLDSYRQKNL